MNDLILITVSAIGGGIVGFLGCALLVQRSIADASEAVRRASGRIDQADAAHARATDALAAKNDRIDRALECVTENSAHVGKKMAAILKGER